MKHTLLRVFRWTLYGCGTLFIFVFGVRIYDEVRYGHLRPPNDVTNIQNFRRWNPSFRKAQIVTIHGSTYYAVTGPFARSMPSGPSEYYFDQNGNYIGRNVDIGDFYEPAIFSAKDAQRKPIDIERIPNTQP